MKAHELLDSPEKWIKGKNAINSMGEMVSSISDNAKCFCIIGAIAHCYLIQNFDIYKDNISKVMFRLPVEIATWNDAPERTYEEVHSLLKELDI